MNSLCKTLLIIIAVGFMDPLRAEPLDSATQTRWAALGFPVDLDRRVPLTDEQQRKVYQFLERVDLAARARQSDDDLLEYIEILIWTLTPMKGDDASWLRSFNHARLRSFADTRYAAQIYPLLRPLLKNRSLPDATRVQAAANMAVLGNKDDIEDVIPLLSSKNKNVRNVTRQVLDLMTSNKPARPRD